VFTGDLGSFVNVGVYVEGSDAANGFLVSLLADHNVLQPASVDLAGTILPGPANVVYECLQGILVTGQACPSTDSLDTLSIAAFASPGSSITAPVSGLLFTATYKIVATSPGENIGFQTGCSSSSIIGSSTCIVISNGSFSPNSETETGGVFVSNLPFAIKPIMDSITALQNTQTLVTVNVTALNGFTGTVTLSSTISPSALSCTLPRYIFNFNTTFTTTLATASCQSSVADVYTINFTATDGQTTTVQRFVSVTVQGFEFNTYPGSIVARNTTTVTYVGVAGLEGFDGIVQLTATITPVRSHIPTVTVSPSSLQLAPNIYAISQVAISTNQNTKLGSYVLTISASYGMDTISLQVPVTVTH
jgi:hypothetical protein